MTNEAITLSPEELRDAPPKREINTADYADRQEQILSALALLDDLGQDAYDHGQVELSARLHQAHADVERFRILERRLPELEPGSRISVALPRFRGNGETIPSNFTVGTVAAYAEEVGWDVGEQIARAIRLGHSLHFAINEGVTITAHKQEPVERIAFELGDLFRLDGKVFKIALAANNNIDLMEVEL